MKNLITLIVIAALGTGCFSFTTTNKKVMFFDGNLKGMKKMAKTEECGYFIIFYASWDKRSEKFLNALEQPEVQQYLDKQYLAFKANIEDHEDLGQRYNITHFPAVVAFNSKGWEVKRLSGSTNSAEFISFLNN
ncbi:MAG: thioredoxin family protein [Bacteroidia bacterium]